MLSLHFQVRYDIWYLGFVIPPAILLQLIIKIRHLIKQILLGIKNLAFCTFSLIPKFVKVQLSIVVFWFSSLLHPVLVPVIFFYVNSYLWLISLWIIYWKLKIQWFSILCFCSSKAMQNFFFFIFYKILVMLYFVVDQAQVLSQVTSN